MYVYGCYSESWDIIGCGKGNEEGGMRNGGLVNGEELMKNKSMNIIKLVLVYWFGWRG